MTQPKSNAVGGVVIGKPVNTQCPKVMNAWKRRMNKMEKTSTRPWIQYEHNPRTIHLRKYTPKESWEIFVDNRPYETNSVKRLIIDLHKEALTRGHIPDKEQEENLRKRISPFFLTRHC